MRGYAIAAIAALLPTACHDEIVLVVRGAFLSSALAADVMVVGVLRIVLDTIQTLKIL